MPQKRTARKGASKAKKPKETQKAQSARFIETARAIGVDESGKEFERALSRLVPTRKRSAKR